MGDLVDLHAEWMRSVAMEPTTIDKRLSVLRRVERACGPLLEVNSADLEAWLLAPSERTGRVPSPSTRRDTLSHAHRFYAWAISHDHADRDPTVRLTRPRMRRRLPRPIPEADYRRALDQAPNPTMLAWLLLGGHAGLRCLEIAGLRGEDVVDGTLRVTGKGGHDRVVPMHPRIAELADQWPRRGPVFVDVAGEPYTPTHVSHQVGRYLRRIGAHASAHQLRHRFATALLEETGDIALVGDVLGHQSLENTRIYARVAPGKKAAAVSRLA